MTIEVSVYDYLPCATKIFKINGIRADEDDFGKINLESLERYTCRISGFTPGRVKQEVLDKYGITVDEFYEICDELDKKFNYGRCSYCR